MLKPYREKFTTKLNHYEKVHASTKLFACFTKNLIEMHLASAFFLFCMCIFNAATGTWVGALIAFLALIWIAYTSITLVRAPAVLRKHYNYYLYPIEVAFNQLSWMDQKKYKATLEEAYQIAARRDETEFDELEKILELFKLKIPAKSKVLSVDEELEMLRVAAKEKQDHDKRLQDIVDELNRNSGL